MNIFNTLALHIGMESGPPLADRKSKSAFFTFHEYNIGGLKWALLDIYEGILRGNRSHPNRPKPRFRDSDRRILYACINVDPRIHFLVSFLALSCPKITVLTTAESEREIDFAVSAYLQRFVRINTETCEVSHLQTRTRN